MIICAKDEDENIARYLPGVLVQKYSSTHEVIVVNDNSVDDSKYILEELQKTFKLLQIVDLKQEAKEMLTNYWGGMVNKGADSFWEVYDPKDDFLSPYNFFPVNSYCHAWSCTPVYFIRKYPEIFQQ